MNSRKSNKTDVLDPFVVELGWFRLELITGRVFADPELPDSLRIPVELSIERLQLDDSICRDIRLRRFQEYINNETSEAYLKKIAPFVWQEAERQNLL